MLSFLVIALQLAAAARPAPSRVLNVCELLADDPTRFNGKVVSVRGLLEGTDEGLWLSDDCKSHLTTRGVTWGDEIWVPEGAEDENAERSLLRFSKHLDSLHLQLGRDTIRVTIAGLIETRKSMDDALVQMPYGLSKFGFGHLSAAAAAIHVMSIRDVTVEDAAKGAYPPALTVAVRNVTTTITAIAGKYLVLGVRFDAVVRHQASVMHIASEPVFDVGVDRLRGADDWEVLDRGHWDDVGLTKYEACTDGPRREGETLLLPNIEAGLPINRNDPDAHSHIVVRFQLQAVCKEGDKLLIQPLTTEPVDLKIPKWEDKTENPAPAK